MPSPRIAIATCSGYADLKVDDGLLREALAARGVESEMVVWDRDGDWSGFDACLVRSTWDYHEKHAELLAWARRIEAAMPLWNDAETIAWSSDKRYLRELAAAGVRTVPTVWVERGSGADLDEVLQGEGWDEAVVKPVVDLGARNLQRARAGEGPRRWKPCCNAKTRWSNPSSRPIALGRHLRYSRSGPSSPGAGAARAISGPPDF